MLHAAYTYKEQKTDVCKETPSIKIVVTGELTGHSNLNSKSPDC